MRNGTEFNVQSGWRTWDDKRNDFLSDGVDATAFNFKYSEWVSSYDPDAIIPEEEEEEISPVEEEEEETNLTDEEEEEASLEDEEETEVVEEI